MIHSYRWGGSLKRASLILRKMNQMFFHASSNHSCSSQMLPSISPRRENFSGCFCSASAFGNSRSSEGRANDQQMLGKLSNFLNLMSGNKSCVNRPCLLGSKSLIHTSSMKEVENGGTSKSMDFVRGLLKEEGRDRFRSSQFSQHNNTEEKLDIVHIKLIKNNTFVTITDSKGNKKVGASSGCLEEMKGGPKLSRYAAEATAEHVGRLARNLGLRSVVMRVNGFTHFKKKKQAILSWREGFTHGRGDRNPIQFIEDTTRRAHNGCRLPKKRRI
ncbi:hypothetical protein Ancab_005586 [Ancistrocladus abbreviatus]